MIRKINEVKTFLETISCDCTFKFNRATCNLNKQMQ